MREGCTSAARGCSTSAQAIPESRNVYLCCRHWCSVLISVACAGDQDMAHVLPLPSDIKVRKQTTSLGIKLWKEVLRGDFLPPVLILSTSLADHPNLLSSGWRKDSADQGVSTTILCFSHGAKFCFQWESINAVTFVLQPSISYGVIFLVISRSGNP